MPLSASAPVSWRFDSLLRIWRAIVGTLLVTPPLIISLIQFDLLCQSGDVGQGATRLTLALSFALLTIGLAMILANRQLMTRPWRAVIAVVLVSPWAWAGLAVSRALFHEHQPGLIASELLTAMLFGAVSITGFRMVVWPPLDIASGWRPFPPDPPPGDAGVPARLKPRPPVLIASAAKEIPRDDA